MAICSICEMNERAFGSSRCLSCNAEYMRNYRKKTAVEKVAKIDAPAEKYKGPLCDFGGSMICRDHDAIVSALRKSRKVLARYRMIGPLEPDPRKSAAGKAGGRPVGKKSGYTRTVKFNNRASG